MHEARSHFARTAVAGCIVVAGGLVALRVTDGVARGFASNLLIEVFDEVLGRWLQLPCDVPYDDGLCDMGSALL
jgi:hypothetical protein